MSEPPWMAEMKKKKNAAETKPEQSKTNDPTPVTSQIPFKNNPPTNAPSVPWAKKDQPTDSASTNANKPPWANTSNVVAPPWSKPVVTSQTITSSPTITNPQLAKNTPPSTEQLNSAPSTANKLPWMAANNSSSPMAGQTQPTAPWAKSNLTVNTNETTSAPPWANKAGNTSVVPTPKNPITVNTTPPVDNTPAWITKANTVKTESSSPSWATKIGTPTNSTTNLKLTVPSPSTNAQNPAPPPWANKLGQKNNANPSVVQANDWKLKQAADIEKQKKELQFKMQQQEQEEKERKRLEKERRQRQKQQADMMRELQAMSNEEDLSRMREQFDKEQDQRRRREEEQREREKREKEERLRRQKEEEDRFQARLEQQKRELQKNRIREVDQQKQSQLKSKVKTSRKSKKEIVQPQRIAVSQYEPAFEKDERQQQNLFHKYQRLINRQASESDYKNKIQIQKAILQTQLQFQRESLHELVGLMDKKKVTNRKRKIVFSNNMEIQYALCEGRRAQSKIEFVTDEVQQLRNRFLQYELLTRSILSLLKKKMSIHLRIPLLNMAEYKGVCFLIEYICQELANIIEIDIDLFQEISNEILILQKELDLNHDSKYQHLKPITRSQLMIKKINIDSQDYYILYIKAESKEARAKSGGDSPTYKSPSKNVRTNNLSNQIVYLNDITYMESIIQQNTLLPYYTPSLLINKASLQYYQKMALPSQKLILKQILLANAIATVYSSCQGEVEEQSFFRLVLEGNKQIWDMINLTGYLDRQLPSPAVLAYMQNKVSIRFNFSKQMFSKNDNQLVRDVMPTVYIQRHELQLLQFMKNLDKYIYEDKQELAEQSLNLNRMLWEEVDRLNGSFNFVQLKYEVSYLLYRKREEQALSFLDNQREKLSALAIEHIPMALLYLKIYISMDAEIPLLKKLSELLEVLDFYFQEETITHGYVYIIVGTYFSKKTNDEPEERKKKVITFYGHALNIILKLYGDKAQQLAQVYLNRANAFLNLGLYDQFHKDIQQALKIFKGYSKSGLRIAECNQLLGRVKCMQDKVSEGVELMESSSSLFIKMANYMEALKINFQILPFLSHNETELQTKLQEIAGICFTYKSVWAFRKLIEIVMDRQLNCYTSMNVDHLIDIFETDEEDERTNEQVLIDLEDQIKGFTSFVQILRWSLSIIAAKIVNHRQITADYEKAYNIMSEVFHFYRAEQNTKPLNLKESHLL